MTVYVDAARQPFRGTFVCHMLADTPEELHRMADVIGLKQRWFQGFDKASCPHYDINDHARRLAVLHGAVEGNRRELVAVMRRIKADREAWL